MNTRSENGRQRRPGRRKLRQNAIESEPEAQDTSLEADDAPDEAAIQVHNFGRSMIKRYLDRAGLNYLRDVQGDFRVDFAHDDDLGCAISFWLMAVGTREEIYGIE